MCENPCEDCKELHDCFRIEAYAEKIRRLESFQEMMIDKKGR
jgi:hypothetical protein